ncbi:hypothetical protein [Burkholderia gladioli]|uniref:hypothetical protein n=1 Tax=Burkholderia gladioli TaxID=28095 RepID=UPI001641D2F8|nr:hypothetical protein [Burkholderia gladioli]
MDLLTVEIRHETLLWDLLENIAARTSELGWIEFNNRNGNPVSALLVCTEAHQDGLGFVRLKLPRGEKTPEDLPAALSVPLHLVAWIAEDASPKSLGFVPLRD